jgi:hypothetical protein
MVLKYVTKNGVRCHEPPYTKEQEAEFYRRVGGGPIPDNALKVVVPHTHVIEITGTRR